jgi:Cu(I)/Ag(I) efflux system periplasmic protein CusF
MLKSPKMERGEPCPVNQPIIHHDRSHFMKLTRTLAAPTLLVAALGIAALAAAQPHGGDHGKGGHGHAMPNAPMTDAEVRKVDKEAGKVTLRHAEIKHMDMPPMTMVFQVRDKAMLNDVKVGDQVRFSVVDERGSMVVTEIRAK